MLNSSFEGEKGGGVSLPQNEELFDVLFHLFLINIHELK